MAALPYLLLSLHTAATITYLVHLLLNPLLVYALPLVAFGTVALDDALRLFSLRLHLTPRASLYVPHAPLICLATLTATVLLLLYRWAHAVRSRLPRSGYTHTPIIAISILIATYASALFSILMAVLPRKRRMSLLRSGVLLALIASLVLFLFVLAQYIELRGGHLRAPSFSRRRSRPPPPPTRPSFPSITAITAASKEPLDTAVRHKRYQILLLLPLTIALALSWYGLRARPPFALSGHLLFLLLTLWPGLLPAYSEPIPHEGLAISSTRAASFSQIQ